MRKRLLKYEGTEQQDGQEVWRMVLPRDRSEHLVVNPRLSDDQIGAVSGQLSAILHGDMGEFAAEIEEAGSEAPAEDCHEAE